METRYILKEARYYRKITGFSKSAKRFLLSQTFFSKIVNSDFYDKFYKRIIRKKASRIKPAILQIENTNICNAKCIMCPHVVMKRKQKIMSQKDFEKIANNVLQCYNIKRLTINGFGEPFADKGIINKIKFLNKEYPGIKIDIYTNAALLEKEVIDKLLNMKVDRMTFSINGTRENYKKIMGLNYDNTMKNVMYFLKENKKRKHRVLTNISLMILDDNKEDVKKFMEFWSPYADSVRTYPPNDWAGGVKNIIYKTPFKYNKRWPCFDLWWHITIDVDGNMIMCCRDFESDVKFGNLLKQDIREIRNSEKLKNLLKRQLEMDFNTPVCNKCNNIFESSLDWVC